MDIYKGANETRGENVSVLGVDSFTHSPLRGKQGDENM